MLDEIASIPQHPERFVLKKGGKYIDPATADPLLAGHRVVDLYGVSEAARQAIYQPVVAKFLNALFQEPAIAMQSIYFEYGSQQSIHQDTAYVVSQRPLSLAAAWIALEDVSEGTGELIYYPGSHRFQHFLFGGVSKSWSKGRDGQEIHTAFLKQLHEQAKGKGFVLEHFLPKKGDVLVWHADLAHGGARITKDHTRKSLVIHFCPQSVKPTYARNIKDAYFELEHESGNFLASRHYDLRSIDSEGRCKVFYDAGISKKRKQAAASATKPFAGGAAKKRELA
jgi:hypothetical protein